MNKPKFILSKKKVLEQYNIVKGYCDAVSYSSKTNQDVTKILESETDSMFSVHSVDELKHIRDCSKVWFLAQALDNDLIYELIEKGIRSFIVDNESDLNVLIDYLSNEDIIINLLLRIKLKENTIRTEKYYVFGMDATFVNNWIRKSQKYDYIDKLGIHFHRKTQNLSEWNLKYELSNIIEDDVWDIIDIVNIGGGLPSVYANTNEDVFDSIFKKIKELKDWLAEKQIQFIIEPGRFIAAPAVSLKSEIVGIHENTVIVNASVYNSDMDALIVPVKLLVKGELEKGEAYVIKGLTPCSMDLFRYKVFLKNPKVGNTLVFLNAGAYNFYSDFCDLEKIETEVVE